MTGGTRNDLLSSFQTLSLKLCDSIIKGLAKIDWSFLLYVRTKLRTIEDASRLVFRLFRDELPV